MQAMRTLMGAVVGCALGALAVIAFGLCPDESVNNAMWPVAVVGLIAGLSMRLVASDGRVNYLRGALAALVALVAFMGGEFSKGAITKRQAPKAPEAAISIQEDSAEADSEGGAEGSMDTVMLPLEELPVVSREQLTAPRSAETTDIIWMAVGALVAYQLGKGAQYSIEEQAEDEEASDPQASNLEAAGEASTADQGETE